MPYRVGDCLGDDQRNIVALLRRRAVPGPEGYELLASDGDRLRIGSA
jgi:hypothetical protein